MIRKTIGESLIDRLKAKRKELTNNNILNIKDNSLYKRIKSKYETFEENDIFKETYPTYKDFENYIINAIEDGNIFITLEFAKNTTKQNYFEQAQIDELVEILKKSGINLDVVKISNKDLFIDNNGKIVDSNPHNDTKSIDLFATYKNYKIYATCKYIKGSGGHQDNQYNDIKTTNKCFIKNNDDNIITLSLCDGGYFTNKRINELSIYNRQNNFIGSTEDVAQFLIDKLK